MWKELFLSASLTWSTFGFAQSCSYWPICGDFICRFQNGDAWTDSFGQSSGNIECLERLVAWTGFMIIFKSACTSFSQNKLEYRYSHRFSCLGSLARLASSSF